MLLNCGVGENSWESLGLLEIQPVHSEGDQSWVFFGRTDAQAETPILWPPHAELTYLKRAWCWKRLKAGGEGDDRGWDSWMASPTQWTWVWVNSGSWWWTGRPGVLWFMALQRVGHDWVTELNVYCGVTTGVREKEAGLGIECCQSIMLVCQSLQAPCKASQPFS